MKALVGISILLFLSSYFTVWQKDISFPIVSSLATIIFALPAIIGAIKWLGFKLGLLLFLLLGVFSYLIETLGLLTSFPYGEFSYNENVGILVSNFIPISLPFAWVPLLLGAYVFAQTLKSNFLKMYIASIFYIIVIDLILDPGAVYLGFWSYSEKGLWYGVPLTNYFGWFLSGSIGFLMIWSIAKHKKNNPPSYIAVSYILSLVFWTGVCFFSKIWGGALIGLVMTIWLMRRQSRMNK